MTREIFFIMVKYRYAIFPNIDKSTFIKVALIG